MCVLENSLKWLKDHIEPEEEVFQKWNETFDLRRHKLREGISVDEYLNLIAALTQQTGKILVSLFLFFCFITKRVTKLFYGRIFGENISHSSQKKERLTYRMMGGSTDVRCIEGGRLGKLLGFESCRERGFREISSACKGTIGTKYFELQTIMVEGDLGKFRAMSLMRGKNKKI